MIVIDGISLPAPPFKPNKTTPSFNGTPIKQMNVKA